MMLIMKNTFLFVIAILLFLPFFSFSQNPTQLGINRIIPNNLWVVHSHKINPEEIVINTSNIYVLRGLADTVWVFGTGYGNSTEVDAYDVNEDSFDSTSGPKVDAMLVDTIIREKFGISKTAVKLQYIVPHHHFDHINQEFIRAMRDTLGYNHNNTNIFVHINDLEGSSCGSLCCGTANCNLSNRYFGVSIEPWDSITLSYFVALGTMDDPQCTTILKTIETPCSSWQIRKDSTQHTLGAVNLVNTQLKMVLLGAMGCASNLPAPWKIFNIHGDIPILSFYKICQIMMTLPPTTNLRKAKQIILPELEIYPNPASTVLNLNLKEEFDNWSVGIQDQLGRTLGTKFAENTDFMQLDVSKFNPGLYFLSLYKERVQQERHKLIIAR